MPPTPPRSPEARPVPVSGPQQSPHTRQPHPHQSHRGYLDSLVVPSGGEIAHISSVQADREAELKRRSREELHRKSARDDASSSQPPPPPPSRSPGGRTSSRGHGHGSLSALFSHRSQGGGGGDSRERGEEDSRRAGAAALIQRTYRGYRTRRQMKGLGIDASTRWAHAIREAQFRELNTPRARAAGLSDPEADVPAVDAGASVAGSGAATKYWKKAVTIARRAGNDADEPGDSDSEPSTSSASSAASDRSRTPREREAARRRREEAREKRRKDAKTLGLQYFLEMVDLKHRYGLNLRTYHEEWKRAATNENFFYWLDYGEGRDMEIAACPRERLDRERVRYLSREERQHYVVKVDEDGRLCWAKNGARIDTTEKWKDSIHGIVPADDPTPAYRSPDEDEGQHVARLLGDSSTAESSSSSDEGDDHHRDPSEAEIEAARAAKYATPGIDHAKGPTKVTHVSASTIFNKLLRKSVRKNTWIFVADTSFRLYVGIKDSGAFQHSSFLQGGRISAAGLIKVKNGRLASLSPLSGHYRPPASNFRAFVRSLKEEGVDMSHVSISKSYAVLVGLEAYVKTRKKGTDMLRRVTHRKESIVAPEELRKREEQEQDKSQSAARERKVLEEEEEWRRDENGAHVKAMQKLHIHPSEPGFQQGREKDGDHAVVVQGQATQGPNDEL